MNINECSGSICDTHCQSSDIIKCTDFTPVVEGDQNYKCECCPIGTDFGDDKNSTVCTDVQECATGIHDCTSNKVKKTPWH